MLSLMQCNGSLVAAFMNNKPHRANSKVQESSCWKLGSGVVNPLKCCFYCIHWISYLFVGVPPLYHGSLESSKDIELQCLRAGVHVFVEKPLSVVHPEEFSTYVQAVEEEQKKKGLILSVGYMFRYHPAVQQMKTILRNHNRPMMGINARYICAYSEMDHPFWWDKMKSGGPIVEQATHFCDLMRYIGGEVKPETISALAIPASDDESKPGCLKALQAINKEDSLPGARRVPRFTAAHCFFSSGAVGNLTHALCLHGPEYEASLEVWADGLRMALEEPYFPECRLRVRRGEWRRKGVGGGGG